MTPLRLLIAYDGSEESGGAARAAGRLFPGARATVLHRPEHSVAIEASLARLALPDAVIAQSAARYGSAAERAARPVTFLQPSLVAKWCLVYLFHSAVLGLGVRTTENPAEVLRLGCHCRHCCHDCCQTR